MYSGIIGDAADTPSLKMPFCVIVGLLFSIFTFGVCLY